MDKAIIRNLLYNVCLQIANLVLPLITVPYVSRVLSVGDIGIYNFSYSVVYYFVILATFGISLYGNRQIAYTRDDKEELTKRFKEIQVLRSLLTFIVLLVFYSTFNLVKINREVFFIQSFIILGPALDISWMYMGLEQFRKPVSLNVLFRCIGVAAVFFFVRDRTDLVAYTVINVASVLVPGILLWFNIPIKLSSSRLDIKAVLSHFIPALKLFIPQVAIQVYIVLDKTLLGLLASVDDVGLFSQTEKLIKAGLSIVTASGAVLMPRMSNYYAKGQDHLMFRFLNTSLRGVLLFSIPMCLALASVSDGFVPWFLGEQYLSAAPLMLMLCPIVFLISISNVLGMQYLIPSNKNKEFTISVFSGAIVNIVLNVLLIPKFAAKGACIATVAAELSVAMIQCFFARSCLDKKYLINGLWKYFVASIVMIIPISVIGSTCSWNLLIFLLLLFSGVMIYVLILLLLKEDILTRCINYVVRRDARLPQVNKN